MIINNSYGRVDIDILLMEDISDLLGRKLLVRTVGVTLDGISDILAHLRGKNISEIVLKQISDSALARLRVDSDNSRFVFSSNVVGVDRQIRNCPVLAIVVLTPLHTLGDSVLMRARESREHELTRIR